MRRSMIRVFKALKRARRSKRPNLTVLLEIESIKEVGRTANLPVQFTVCHEIAIRLAQCSVQGSKRPGKRLRSRQVLLGTFCVNKPKKFVFDNRSAEPASELLP